jgi:hypothetical protein
VNLLNYLTLIQSGHWILPTLLILVIAFLPPYVYDWMQSTGARWWRDAVDYINDWLKALMRCVDCICDWQCTEVRCQAADDDNDDEDDEDDEDEDENEEEEEEEKEEEEEMEEEAVSCFSKVQIGQESLLLFI